MEAQESDQRCTTPRASVTRTKIIKNQVVSSPNRPLKGSSGDHNKRFEISTSDIAAASFSRTAGGKTSTIEESQKRKREINVASDEERNKKGQIIKNEVLLPNRALQKSSGDHNLFIGISSSTDDRASFSRNADEKKKSNVAKSQKRNPKIDVATDQVKKNKGQIIKKQVVSPPNRTLQESSSGDHNKRFQKSTSDIAAGAKSRKRKLKINAPNRPLHESGDRNSVIEISSSDDDDASFSRTGDEKKDDIAKTQRRKWETSVVNDHEEKRKKGQTIKNQVFSPNRPLQESSGDHNLGNNEISVSDDAETDRAFKRLDSAFVFLYRKRVLDDSTHCRDNLFMTKIEKLMNFLSEEERKAMTDTEQGLVFSALDPHFKSYTLRLSLLLNKTSLIIDSPDWKRLITGNNVAKGDWIQLWGSRYEGRFHLSVNIRKRKPEEDDDQRTDVCWSADTL